MQLVGAVLPERVPDAVQDQELSPLATPRSVAQIRRLQQAGIVDVVDGQLQMRTELQLSVVAGAMMAIAVLRELGPDQSSCPEPVD